MHEPDKRILDARLRAANTALDAKVAASVDVEAALARVKRNAARREPALSGITSSAVYRTIVVVDVEGFGSRTDLHRSAIRRSMYVSLERAFDEAGISWQDCDTVQDRGDGLLILVPPSAATASLVDELPNRLTATLRRHNANRTAAGKIRLRMAVHMGEVAYDNEEIAGQAVNFAYRMLDAPALSAVLAASQGTVGVVVSDSFYREVVQSEPATRPHVYLEAFVGGKEHSGTPAWIQLPGDPPTTGGSEQEPADADGTIRQYEPRPTSLSGDLRSLSMLAASSQSHRRALISRVVLDDPDDEPVRVTPGQLPTDVPAFVGRTAELDRLTTLLGSDEPGPVVVDGPPGVGKTALAVHWAHQQTERFPDGHLFVDLQGFDHQPTPPSDPLRELLATMGVSTRRIPADIEEQARLYRSMLAERRMLVILDNVRDSDQVRQLLPGHPGSLAVATSRRRLTSLIAREGARWINLDTLPPADSVALLTRIASDAEPDTAAELAQLCGHMPLALRIAAEHAGSESMRLRDVVDELRESPDHLLSWSSPGDRTTSVRTVFSWSYTTLSADAARLFRLLGTHPLPDISTEAAGALIGVAPPQARRLLHDLAAAHMVEIVGRDRYRLHELMRLYAAERARQDSE